jgi:hypothetical protein
MAAPRPEHAHVCARPADATPTTRPLHPQQHDGGKTNVLLSANGPSTVAQQQRCHRTSALARSPSWPTMPSPRLQRAATVRQEKIQLPIAGQNFSRNSRDWASNESQARPRAQSAEASLAVTRGRSRWRRGGVGSRKTQRRRIRSHLGARDVIVE